MSSGSGTSGGNGVPKRLEHLIVVRLRRGLRDDVHDGAVGVDDERRAVHAHVGLAVHRLLAPGPVLLGDRVVGVREQREVEVLLVVELADRLDGVGRHAEDADARGLVVGAVVANAARLRRAAGGVRLGIEVEDDGRAAQVAEAHGVAVVVGARGRGGPGVWRWGWGTWKWGPCSRFLIGGGSFFFPAAPAATLPPRWNG